MPRPADLVITPTADQSNTAYSARYQQTYHSTHGAVSESMHVFIQGSGLLSRLQTGQVSRVLEIGFGLGLNCLLCADFATQHDCQLTYVTVDHDIIGSTTLAELGFSELLDNPALVHDLATTLAQPVQAISPVYTGMLGAQTTLELHDADATSSAVKRTLDQQPCFDAIFLDAFSPDANPECWSTDFLHWLARQLAPDGMLATYSAKGAVRRALGDAGLVVQKVPGPAGKREVMRAYNPRQQ